MEMRKSTMITVVFLLVETIVCVVTTSSNRCPRHCSCFEHNSTHDLPLAEIYVDCSRKQIRNVSEILLEMRPDTTTLDLSNNLIKSLPANQFSRFTNLSSLHLHDNLIDTLEPNVFRGLQQLRMLDLRRNRIRTIKSDAFSETTGSNNCEDVSLRENQVKQIHCGIDLTQNNVVNIERNAFAWIKRLSLYLGKSPVALNIDPYAFYGAQQTSYLVISDVPSVNLGARFFTNMEGLTSLIISNTSILQLNSFVFEGLKFAENLSFLNVSFLKIDEYAFSGIHFVPNTTTEFTGRHRALVSRQSNSGGEIRFHNCTFQYLPTDAFRDTNLAKVSITNSKIHLIKSFAFRGMSALQDFYVLQSEIKELEQGGFGSLRNLDKLHLEEVDLQLIASESFVEVSDIVSFKISVTTPVTLDSEAFSGCINVKTFELSGATPGIRLSIRDEAFQNFVSVDQVIIRNLSLPVLEKGVFVGMTKIKNLKIENCNVTQMSRFAFGDSYGHQGAVESLTMDVGNNLTCDCQTVFILRHLRYKFFSYSVPCRTEGGETLEAGSERLSTDCKNTGSNNRSSPVVLILTVLLLICFQSYQYCFNSDTDSLLQL